MSANVPSTSYNDQVVRQFAIMTVVWGIVGMAVGVLIAAQLLWPALNFHIPWLTYMAHNVWRTVRDTQPVEVAVLAPAASH